MFPARKSSSEGMIAGTACRHSFTVIALRPWWFWTHHHSNSFDPAWFWLHIAPWKSHQTVIKIWGHCSGFQNASSFAAFSFNLNLMSKNQRILRCLVNWLVLPHWSPVLKPNGIGYKIKGSAGRNLLWGLVHRDSLWNLQVTTLSL